MARAVFFLSLMALAAGGRFSRAVEPVTTAGLFGGPTAMDSLPIDLVANSHDDLDSGDGNRRLYLSGIVGASFATLCQPDLPALPAIANQTLWTGGLAAGVIFDRPHGGLRTEFEARSREQIRATDVDPGFGYLSQTAGDGWSTMANLWRDLSVSRALDVYIGGGIGAGGYRYIFDGRTAGGGVVSGSTGISSFAWQAGGGVVYAVTDRVRLDLGYRFFALQPGDAAVSVTTAGVMTRDTLATAFSASELLLSIRVEEPFRRWRSTTR